MLTLRACLDICRDGSLSERSHLVLDSLSAVICALSELIAHSDRTYHGSRKPIYSQRTVEATRMCPMPGTTIQPIAPLAMLLAAPDGLIDPATWRVSSLRFLIRCLQLLCRCTMSYEHGGFIYVASLVSYLLSVRRGLSAASCPYHLEWAFALACLPRYSRWLVDQSELSVLSRRLSFSLIFHGTHSAIVHNSLSEDCLSRSLASLSLLPFGGGNLLYVRTHECIGCCLPEATHRDTCDLLRIMFTVTAGLVATPCTFMESPRRDTVAWFFAEVVADACSLVVRNKPRPENVCLSLRPLVLPSVPLLLGLHSSVYGAVALETNLCRVPVNLVTACFAIICLERSVIPWPATSRAMRVYLYVDARHVPIRLHLERIYRSQSTLAFDTVWTVCSHSANHKCGKLAIAGFAHSLHIGEHRSSLADSSVTSVLVELAQINTWFAIRSAPDNSSRFSIAGSFRCDFGHNVVFAMTRFIVTRVGRYRRMTTWNVNEVLFTEAQPSTIRPASMHSYPTGRDWLQALAFYVLSQTCVFRTYVKLVATLSMTLEATGSNHGSAVVLEMVSRLPAMQRPPNSQMSSHCKCKS